MQYQLLIHEFNPDSGRGYELTLNDQPIQDEFPITPSVGDFISPWSVQPDSRSGEVFKVLSIFTKYGPAICMIHVTVAKATQEEGWRIVPEA